MLASESARATDKTAQADFSSYPQTDLLRYYLNGQTNAAWNLQHTNLLAISAFPDGGKFALRCSVTESGQESDYRDVYNWAIQAIHSKNLSGADVKSLRSAIHNLPAVCASPPFERLVIISFREGTNWLTRSYDSGKIPKAMREIYDIVGERK